MTTGQVQGTTIGATAEAAGKTLSTANVAGVQSPTFVDFNPTSDERVTAIKTRTDELIEMIHSYEKDLTNAGMRRAALAITNYEQAAMWAVKALFSK
jgi:hypothetical protein